MGGEWVGLYGLLKGSQKVATKKVGERIVRREEREGQGNARLAGGFIKLIENQVAPRSDQPLHVMMREQCLQFHSQGKKFLLTVSSESMQLSEKPKT